MDRPNVDEASELVVLRAPRQVPGQIHFVRRACADGSWATVTTSMRTPIHERGSTESRDSLDMILRAASSTHVGHRKYTICINSTQQELTSVSAGFTVALANRKATESDPMTFRGVFITVFLGTSLVVAAVVVNRARPTIETAQPTKDLVRSVGKCAECHRQETAAIVHQFDTSRHASEGVVCLDCHRPMDKQEPYEHYGFTLATDLTAQNCAQCHATQYREFLRSRHAAPAWGAVTGAEDFTDEQIAHAEEFHPGTVKRPPNNLAQLEGAAAMRKGCMACHGIGRPNADGSIGTCTACHARHASSVALARLPRTCGQCHMGPDHAQIEIYTESKHGVMFNAQRLHMNLSADPQTLSTEDMSVPTCATCHMSGLDGQQFTHDTTGRLSYFLYAAVSDKRPHYTQAQVAMKETCMKCHAESHVDTFYEEAEAVVADTNVKVQAAKDLMDALYAEGLLTPEPYDEPIEFIYFDLWHYYGRTAKHGAFMGGADFVQWHGNYELLLTMTEMEEIAAELRHKAAERTESTDDATAAPGTY